MKNHQLSTINHQPTVKPTSFTCLAFLVNRVIDARPDRDLSFNETFDAASEGRLIALLAERCGHITNFTWVTQRDTVNVEQMEAALCDAAAGFEGRVGKATCPLSGLCLVMDIVLEAIQRQCSYAQIKNEKPSISRVIKSSQGFSGINFCTQHRLCSLRDLMFNRNFSFSAFQ